MRLFNVTVGTKPREGEHTVMYVDDARKIVIFDRHYEVDGETKSYTVKLKQGEIKWDKISDTKYTLGRFLGFKEDKDTGDLNVFKNIITILSEVQLDDWL